MTGISYDDFVDTGYTPADTDLVCEFHVDLAAGVDMSDAVAAVESLASASADSPGLATALDKWGWEGTR